jgi:C-terminal processing protease CtpA/Prc
MKNYFLPLLALAFLFSCSDSDTNENPIEEAEISITATNFLNEVIGIMESNSLNRNTIDWSEFRNDVFEVAETAQSIDDVYDSGALLRALELLGDNHSSIIRNNGERISASTAVCLINSAPPEAGSIPDNIGYIFVLGFNGQSEDEESKDFAENLHQIISEKDSPENIGWIVDLRPNTGGNMFPMLTGIGPILGEGIAGYFIGPDGEESSWSYSEGTSFSNGISRVQAQNPYTLFNENPKVAVLLDKATASSGEAIAISFINRDKTASFGSPTCGISTGNGGYSLSDNSTLILTQVVLADRQNNTFGSSIQPDFEVSNEEVIARAVEYLQND